MICNICNQKIEPDTPVTEIHPGIWAEYRCHIISYAMECAARYREEARIAKYYGFNVLAKHYEKQAKETEKWAAGQSNKGAI